MKNRVIICVILLSFAAVFNLHGKLDEPTFVQGIVRDSLTMQGIPYASVRLLPGGNATIADSLGLFELNAPAGSTLITASSQGYAPKSVELVRTSHNLYDIQLSAQAQELKEVVVRKRKYSKRNNPAVDFVRRIRQARELTDPRRNDFYNYSTYQRITLGINDFDTAANSATMRRMPFLAEHIESSEIDGKPVLFVSLKEQSSDSHYRRSDDRTKNIVQGTRSNGVDEIIDASNTETILNDLLRPVDLYDNDINLLKNTFVSPLSPLAPDFYRFYLTDSAAVVPGSDTPHIALAFYPRNKASFGFVGHIYVPAA
ncbi:MAG: carboxypeptidase-like regulatory domain-containing protein, partial [Muribaculaceae bacterium]|nr:carboxypeptidase-like regulatory domain-containing protein [Muribaculaceae bacterium]